MLQLLTEDVVQDRYSAVLANAEADRRAAHQVELKRAYRRVERARARLDRALEETFALPAKPNPVTGDMPVTPAITHEREKQAA